VPLLLAGNDGDEALLQETPISISTTGSSFAPESHQLINVVIADGRPIFRDGLRRLLQTEPRLRIVGETRPGFSAATLVRDLRPDILLVDFAPQTTFETLKTLAESGEAVRTIILAECVDGADLTKALELGARGLVLRDSAADVLFKSIHSVLAGQYWIASDSVVDAAAGQRKLEAELRRRREFGLTPRELEIVRMVLGGSTNKEIGEKLAISENTVKTHLTHIFNKVGASSRIELALFAAHHGLFDSA
jgi:two-component system, NarL family, nitrate/nitrite response regulator NarL